jgi:hypothetical protein
MQTSFFSAWLGLFIVAIVAMAGCAPSTERALGPGPTVGDDAGDDAPASTPVDTPSEDPPVDDSAEDASSATPSVDEASAPTGDKSALGADDAGPDDASADDDGPPDGACTDPLSPGDLLIDELMIESVAGTGDYGEWLEVANAKGCAVDLRGLHGECPKASKVVTVDVSDDVWVPAGGFFVIADSVDPSVNHDLPGTVLGWLGSPGDVLRNDGTTITLSVTGTVIDTLTFPKLTLTVGASVEFPSDCDAGERSDFSKWQTATSSWFPGFYGTPGAVNDDVSCQ